MNFFTALKLSGKNIATKKWRTTLTAFASSIGIIGIALVLSLSNGFDKQISSIESDTLSGFPIMISQSTSEIDMSARREKSEIKMTTLMLNIFILIILVKMLLLIQIYFQMNI